MRRFLIALLCLAPCLAQAQLESTSDLQRGLVGWWRFNEGTGTSANDLSGNANTGTLSGSTLPVWTNGVFGGALWFETNYVSLGSPIGTLNAYTISAWGYLTNTNPNWELIAGKDSSHGFWVSVTRKLTIQATALLDSGVNLVSLNAWHHLVCSGDASSCKLYIDGVVVGSSAGIGSVNGYTGIGGGSLISDGVWIGKLDDVRIYSRALSATEILNLYCQGGGRTP